MEEPAQLVGRRRAVADQSAAVVDDELGVTGRPVQAGFRQVGLAQCDPRHGLGVDRVGLAAFAG